MKLAPNGSLASGRFDSWPPAGRKLTAQGLRG
jgi:hypothetical protein